MNIVLHHILVALHIHTHICTHIHTYTQQGFIQDFLFSGTFSIAMSCTETVKVFLERSSIQAINQALHLGGSVRGTCHL